MRTFRFRSAGVAMALVAGSAVGAQLIAVKPAVAQVPLFVVGPTTTDSYPINAGEKVPLGKILNVRSLDPNPVIIDIAAAASEGILINGVKAFGKSSSTGGDQITWDEDAWAFHFPTLQAALEANVTAYQGGRIAIRITARSSHPP